MGFYSEQDIELRYGDSPFEEGGSPPDNTRMQSTPAFTEADPVESAVTQPAAETVVPQPQQNTAPAPSVSEQAVETPPETSTDAVAGQAAETADGAVSEDDKKKAHEEAEAKRKAEWEARQAAKKLSDAFEMRVIAYDPFLSAEEITSAGGRKAELDEVMRESDFVSINVSLLPSTRDLIGRRELALMKPTAFLINCSRGGIVNEEDLIEALEKKRIAGAGLDTSTREPLPKDSPFCRLDNVIMTPHAAWYTVEAMGDVQRVAAEQVALVLTGQKPTRCVNYEEANKYKNRRTQWNRRR